MISLAILALAAAPPLIVRSQRDVSRPLRLIEPQRGVAPRQEANEVEGVPAAGPSFGPDTVAQVTPAATTALAGPVLSFDGLGPSLGWTNLSPTDANGDVGPNHYVQVVNRGLAIFDKRGTLLYGPALTVTLFKDFADRCGSVDGGDPVVVYDSLADRWVITYLTWLEPPDLSEQCVAVSQSGDPTGAWYRYAFYFPRNNDYGKLGVWPNEYILTTLLVLPLESRVCALDRARMLSGLDATAQCFSLPGGFDLHALPADLDGRTPPPANSDFYALTAPIVDRDMGAYRFHIDWSHPAQSIMSARRSLLVEPWEWPKSGAPQPGTTVTLDQLPNVLMHRLAYRNFGDHEALVVSHNAEVGGVLEERWYELRLDANRDLFIYQQGTFAPDSTSRWMGSAAMDRFGNLAIGYSASSTSLYPSIRYTGRLPGDTPGLLTLGEGVIVEGSASQTWSTRWGDYSSLQVDPSDDCTFWYTNSYVRVDGLATRIGAFRLPGCGNDFALAVEPASQQIEAGGAANYNVRTSVAAGAAEPVALSVEGLPAEVSASFAPPSVTAGGTAVLTLAALPTAPIGTVRFSVRATSPSSKHDASAELRIVAAPDFAIALDAAAVTLAPGESAAVHVTTTASGSSLPIDLGIAGLPPGVTAAFQPASVHAGEKATLVLSAGAAASPGTGACSVIGRSGQTTHAAALAVTVVKPESDGGGDGGGGDGGGGGADASTEDTGPPPQPPAPRSSGGGCTTGGTAAAAFWMGILLWSARRRKRR
jgi:hypothetical protein